MSIPTSDPNKRKPGFFQIPAINAPSVFFEFLQSERLTGQEREQGNRILNRLYPKLGPISPADRQRIADLGELRISQEYIVVGDIKKDYTFLKEGHRFTLKRGDFSIQVDVVKNRCCGQTARTLILLHAVDSASLEALADINEVLDVTKDQIDANILGTVVTGKSNASGSGQGYPNAYGHGRPVLPASFLPFLEVVGLDPPRVSPSGDLPLEKPSTDQHPFNLLAWLLLLFYQFLAWLLSAFGLQKSVPGQKLIKVAILDSGLGSQWSGGNLPAGSCDEMRTGWNFVDNSPDIHDDHYSHHGTRIKNIIQQQAPSAVCLSIKTANKDGICELYDVLCGLEYARVNKANVINASFSFSANAAPKLAIPLLHAMIASLEKEDIWIIAAAGNAVQYVHDGAGNTPPLGQDAPFLYPACYSDASTSVDTTDRIITVTTVSKTQQDGTAPLFGLGECYSLAFVDVGVIANSQLSTAIFIDNKSFKAPGFDPEPGTSYATAYLTGRVASALAGHTFAGKTQLMATIGPELKPDLAIGIHAGQSVVV